MFEDLASRHLPGRSWSWYVDFTALDQVGVVVPIGRRRRDRTRGVRMRGTQRLAAALLTVVAARAPAGHGVPAPGLAPCGARRGAARGRRSRAGGPTPGSPPCSASAPACSSTWPRRPTTPRSVGAGAAGGRLRRRPDGSRPPGRQRPAVVRRDGRGRRRRRVRRHLRVRALRDAAARPRGRRRRHARGGPHRRGIRRRRGPRRGAPHRVDLHPEPGPRPAQVTPRTPRRTPVRCSRRPPTPRTAADCG